MNLFSRRSPFTLPGREKISPSGQPPFVGGPAVTSSTESTTAALSHLGAVNTLPAAHSSSAVRRSQQQLSVIQFVAELTSHLQQADPSRATALLVVELRRSDRLFASAQTLQAHLVEESLADRLSSVLRPNDLFCWVNADEVWLMLPDLASATIAVVAANKILKLLEVAFLNEGAAVHMRPCIGIACFPEHAMQAMPLLEAADEARQQARPSETAYVVYRPDPDRRVEQNHAFEIELRQALQSNVLEVFYQPQVKLSSGHCHAVEALIRWTRADGQRASPAQIAQVAENTGLMHGLTNHVLNTVLRELAELAREGIHISASVNLSARMLGDHELPEMIWQGLQTWGVAPDKLTVEVTESSIIHDVDHSIQMLKALKELDVRLSIDDFGTGYSSLAYLRHFPLDELKIDRLFIANMLKSRADVQIVRSVIGLAHNFELQAVAEGVEDEQTLFLLRQLGCDVVQGFWYGRPMPLQEFRTWWRAQRLL